KLRNSAADDAAYETNLPSGSDVEIPHVQRVVFDKLPARLDDIAHQNREHFVGVDCVVLIQVDFQQFAFLGIHCGLQQFLGIHLTEALETFDLHSATANLQNLLQNFRNGKQRMRT